MEVKGEFFTAINNDCVEETAQMPENSVGLIHTSIPFSNHYEYTPSYNDFGHNEDTGKFFDQMDYLTPNLLRILQPGRVLAVHVKDRCCSATPPEPVCPPLNRSMPSALSTT